LVPILPARLGIQHGSLADFLEPLREQTVPALIILAALIFNELAILDELLTCHGSTHLLVGPIPLRVSPAPSSLVRSGKRSMQIYVFIAIANPACFWTRCGLANPDDLVEIAGILHTGQAR
jgi:hypothetical protein